MFVDGGVNFQLQSEVLEVGKILRGAGIVEREDQQPVGWTMRKCCGGPGLSRGGRRAERQGAEAMPALSAD